MKRKARLQRCLRNLLAAVIILIHAAPFYILITTKIGRASCRERV